MDNSLNEIFVIIDNLDADEKIKQFYKDALEFETKGGLRYKPVYEMLINQYVEDEL